MFGTPQPFSNKKPMQSQITWIIIIHGGSEVEAFQPSSRTIHQSLRSHCTLCSQNIYQSYSDRDNEDNHYSEWRAKLPRENLCQALCSTEIFYPTTSHVHANSYPSQRGVRQRFHPYSRGRAKLERLRLRQAVRSTRNRLPRCAPCPVS